MSSKKTTTVTRNMFDKQGKARRCFDANFRPEHPRGVPGLNNDLCLVATQTQIRASICVTHVSRQGTVTSPLEIRRKISSVWWTFCLLYTRASHELSTRQYCPVRLQASPGSARETSSTADGARGGSLREHSAESIPAFCCAFYGPGLRPAHYLQL